MLARDVRSMKTEQIEERLAQARQELFVLRRDKASGRLDDHNRIHVVKRDIARMRTILRERELSAELAEGGGAR
jgi:large subunit ribosomal protein L29